jgi:hypothetical protein
LAPLGSVPRAPAAAPRRRDSRCAGRFRPPRIGRPLPATLETDAGHLVVDTGPWIFGKKVMLPAGVIKTVDHVNEKVFVNRTKDEIKNAPEFDESMRSDESTQSAH